jgi:hypothetical protein
MPLLSGESSCNARYCPTVFRHLPGRVQQVITDPASGGME